MSISKYGEVCSNLLSNWSKDREKDGQQFQETYKFKDETWKLADNFLYRKQGTIKQVDNSEVFILSKDKETIISADFIAQNFAKISLNFDQFIETLNSVQTVKFVIDKWSAESLCSCWYFLKKYHCYHIFVVAINKQIITIPNVFKNALIGQKPKAGRKPKALAGHCLIKD